MGPWWGRVPEVGGDWASVNWGHKVGEEAKKSLFFSKPTMVKALTEAPGVIKEVEAGEGGLKVRGEGGEGGRSGG